VIKKILLFQFQHAKVTIQSIVSLDNPDYASLSLKTATSATGSSTINMTAILKQDITVAKCLVIISIPKDKNDRNYENVVMETTVDLCKMFQGMTGSFITRMIMENIKDKADFELKCPLKKVKNILG
jgi:hypothetical protein